MEMERIVGLDVSKHWLDGYCSGSGLRLRVRDDVAGIDDLARELAGGTACLVVMEASGGYEASAHRALVAKGVRTAIVNPKRVRDFAKASDVTAKANRIDAAVIAGHGAFQKPAATPAPHPMRAELTEILACRRQCSGEFQVRRQQLEHMQSAAIRGRMLEVIAFLEQERDALDRL
jgi:transposase